ncbi:MAG: hypothetical protein J1G04_06065 [Clostridiales bacterium]|nr:hypothetical protein [Clostridiales bacterium]
MTVNCVYEHNGKDTLLYADNYVGAYTRGNTVDIAIAKMPLEIKSYLQWLGKPSVSDFDIKTVQEKVSTLSVCDADSDVIFDSEKLPLAFEEYIRLKELCLKSAQDFLKQYELIPDRDKSALPHRDTFYGKIPRTATEMYEHTKNVNSYYFGEIGVEANNDGTILECRRIGFEALEKNPDFLSMPVIVGSYDELWSLRKVLRRFIWHDRIHAKAMYRMAQKTFDCEIENVFKFAI